MMNMTFKQRVAYLHKLKEKELKQMAALTRSNQRFVSLQAKYDMWKPFGRFSLN